MVTGIETAGLVLGAFPIVIEGLKYYINCAKKVREISRHKYVLRQFLRDIEVEMTIFENIWYELTGCDPFGAKSGKLPDSWAPKLPAHLRSNSIDSIEIVCEGMRGVLEGLQQKFQKYEQKEAGYLKMLEVTFSLSDEYRTDQLALIRRYNVQFRELVTGAQPPAAARSELMKSVRVAKSYYKVRENAMILYNVLKEKLLSAACSCQGPHSAGLQLQLRVSGVPKKGTEGFDSGSLGKFTLIFPVRSGSSVPGKAPSWQELEIENVELALDTPPEPLQSPRIAIREAESNAAMLVGGVVSMAESMETSRLYSPTSILGSSPNSPATPKKQRVGPEGGLTVSVMEQFGKMKCWVQKPARSTRNSRSRSTSPMPGVPETPPPLVTSGPRKVAFDLPHGTQQQMSTGCRVRTASLSADIISCLCTAIRNAGALHKCLGVLVSTGNLKHRLWIPERPGCIHFQRSAKTVTLAEVLCLPPPSTKERLKLGVKLASSVLQLHETPWLGERWSKQDIRFITPVGACTSRSSMIEHPFLQQDFVPPNTPPPENPIRTASIVPCNISLYSLGIVLIELWYWKDFRCLQGSVSTGSGTSQDAQIEFFTAFQFAKDLHDEAGKDYGEAVRRCIQGLDTRETCLGKEGFKNKVYSDIVRLLEENLETFSGMPITDIFGIDKI